jgi:hypothetical protein
MVFRKALAWWAGLLAFLGGCSTLGIGFMCMGVQAPPQHPTASLNGAQALVPPNLRPASKIPVKAYTRQAPSNGKVEAVAYRPETYNDDHRVTLHDDGLNGDRVPNDGEWYGELAWGSFDAGTYKMYVVLSFNSGPRQPYYSPQIANLPDIHYPGQVQGPQQEPASDTADDDAGEEGR